MKKVFGKMNPEIKVKFLESLKSGKYKKALESLKEVEYKHGEPQNTCYCGGGVLMDLYAKEKKKGWDSAFPGWKWNEHIIPNKVLKWAGLPEVNQIHFTPKSDMMTVNDGSGEDQYRKVIKYVEKYL